MLGRVAIFFQNLIGNCTALESFLKYKKKIIFSALLLYRSPGFELPKIFDQIWFAAP